MTSKFTQSPYTYPAATLARSRGYFAYIRVSSSKQEDGASLPAQRRIIQEYATREKLTIIKEFAEIESAAKQGRTQFTKMLVELKAGRADGVIFHKIDRGARNLKDWAELKEIFQIKKIDVRFAAGGIDLHTPAGSLTGDIMAALASHYIVNLIEEVKKGQKERLESGLYPFGPPIGYLPAGPGKPKIIDPVQGPLVKKCFEIYSSGAWTVRDLVPHMNKLGLKTSRGNRLEKNAIRALLINPFYMGILRVKDKTYKGIHKPLISPYLFKKVQDVLAGKRHKQVYSHSYIFKNMLGCGYCKKTLRCVFAKKRYHYYYCRDKTCEMRCVSEEKVEKYIGAYLEAIAFNNEELESFKAAVKDARKMTWEYTEKQVGGLNLKLNETKSRLEKLLDLMLEGRVTEEEYEQKKTKLIFEVKELESQVAQYGKVDDKTFQQLEKLGKLLKNPYLAYKLASPEKRRQLVSSLLENFLLTPEKLLATWKIPFDTVANRAKSTSSGADGTRTRNLIRDRDAI